MPRDIIVMGASAGGIEVLTRITAGLPETLPASLFVVLHQADESPGRLPDIFNHAGPLPAAYASHDEPIRQGRIYLAPPGRHLLLTRRRIRLESGPTENRYRPSVDVLFRSAAEVFGPRVIGVVVSGALDDGTAGLRAIKARGGLAVVQNPEEAFAPGMPASACAHVEVDYIEPMARLAERLGQLAALDVADAVPANPGLEHESAIQRHPEESILPDAPATGLTCPDCHGALFEMRDGQLVRYRCRVGHAYSPESLVAQHGAATERAGWAAVRSLEEDAALARRLAKNARDRNFSALAAGFDQRAVKKDALASALRTLILESVEPPTE